MPDLTATFEETVWRWEGPAAWHFVNLPPDLADEIAEQHAAPAAGFGSVRVEVRIGATVWLTSLFPDSRSKTYLLPIKRAVRTAEDLADGSPVTVHLRVPMP